MSTLFLTLPFTRTGAMLCSPARQNPGGRARDPRARPPRLARERVAPGRVAGRGPGHVRVEAALGLDAQVAAAGVAAVELRVGVHGLEGEALVGRDLEAREGRPGLGPPGGRRCTAGRSPA